MFTPTMITPADYNAAAYLSWTDSAGALHTFFPDLVLSENWSENATVTEHPVEQGANVVDHVRVELVKCELALFATNEPVGANNFTNPELTAVVLEGLDGPGQVIPSPPVADVWDANLALKGALLAAGGAIGGLAGGVVGNAIGAAAGALLGGLVTGKDTPTPVPTVITVTAAPTVIGQATVQTLSESQDFVQQTIELLEQLKSSAQLVTLNGSKQVVQNMVIESFTYVREAETGTGAEITLGLKEVRIVQTQTVNVPLQPRASSPTTNGNQNPSDGSAAQQTDVLTQLGSLGAGALSKVGSFLGL